MKTKFQIGDRVKVSSEEDNENYDSFRNKVLIVDHVATNKNEHPGYDSGVGGGLYDFRTEDGKYVNFSLYAYELIHA